MLPHYYRKYLSYQKRLEIKLMHFSLDIYIYSYILFELPFCMFFFDLTMQPMQVVEVYQGQGLVQTCLL